VQKIRESVTIIARTDLVAVVVDLALPVKPSACMRENLVFVIVAVSLRMLDACATIASTMIDAKNTMRKRPKTADHFNFVKNFQ